MTDRLAIDYDFLRRMQIQADIVPGENVDPAPGAQQGPPPPPGALPKWETTPQWALEQAFENPVLIGGEDDRMAMFPDEYIKKEDKGKKGASWMEVAIAPYERGYRNILMGIGQMIPASLTVAGGILEFAGADKAGETVAGAGISVGEWLQEHVAVENPNLVDHVLTGAGSMLTFMLPGLGTASLVGKAAQALQLVGKAAKAFQAVTGAGAMSFLEATVEQSQRQQELMAQGMTAGEALEASKDVFWNNMWMLMLTNLAFWSPGARAARMALSAVTEGGQERAQSVFQDVAAGRGEFKDFLDKEKYWTETLVGTIVGSGAAAVMPREGGKQTEKEDTSAPAPIEAEPFEGEAPEGTKPYEPILTSPPEVPGGPPVSPAPPPAQRPPSAAADAGAAIGAQLAQDEQARNLIDESDYTALQAIGRLENMLEEELGVDVDFATQLKPWQIDKISDLVQEAEALDLAGKTQEAWDRADQVVALAKTMLSQHQEGAGTFTPADVPPKTKKAKPAPKATPKPAPQAKPAPVVEGEHAGYEYRFISHTEGSGTLVEYGEPGGETKQEVKQDSWTIERFLENARAAQDNRTTYDPNNPAGIAKPAPAGKANFRSVSPQEMGDIATTGKIAGGLNRFNDFDKRREVFFGEGLDKELIGQGEELERQASHRVRSAPGFAEIEAEYVKVAKEAAPLEKRLRDEDIGRNELEPLTVKESRELQKLRVKRDKLGDDHRNRIKDKIAEIQKEREGKPYTSFVIETRPLEGGKRYEGKASGMTAAEIGRESGEVTAEDIAAVHVVKGGKVVERIEFKNVKDFYKWHLDEIANPPTPVQKLKKKAKKAAKGISLMATSALTVERGTFQKRGIKIDNPESGTNEAKLAAIQEGFDPKKLDPIVAWVDPADGKLKVLDGHHTLEIAKRNGITEVNVKIFEGTKKQAIREAQELNDRVTVNDPFSRAETVRANRESGMPKKMVEAKARSLYQEQATTVLKLSYLNPKGKAIQTLQDLNEGSDEYGRALRYAKWIGEARERFPTLTNQHEKEMFDFLVKYGNKPGLSSATSFIATVEARSVLGSFEGMESLNLNRASEAKGAKASYEDQLADLKGQLKAAKTSQKEAIDRVKQQAKDIEDRIKSSTDPKEKAALKSKLILKGKAVASAVKKIKTVTTVENDKPVKGSETADKIASIESDLMKLKQEWRVAQDELADGGEGVLFNVLGVTPAEKENFIAEKRALLADGLITDAGITASPGSPHARTIEGLMKRWGRKVIWFKADVKPGGKQIGGWYDQETGSVFMNRSLKEHPVLPVSMHEVTHHMETQHPDLWNDVYKSIIENLAPGAYKLFEANRISLKYSRNKVPGELAAEMMAEVASKDKFWRDLKKRNPRAFSALVNKLLDVLKSVRNFLLKSKHYHGLEAYTTDFGKIERAASKAFATMSEREFGKEPAPGPEGQGVLFSIIPDDATPYMRKKLEAYKQTVKGIRNARKKHGWGITRYIYEMMVDENTWVWHDQKKALKAMGKDIYDERSIDLPNKWLQKMVAWTEKADYALKRGVWSWDGETPNYELGFQQIISKHKLAYHADTGEFGVFMQAARMKAQEAVLGDSYFGGETEETQDVLFKEGVSEQEKAARAEFAESEQLYEDYKGREGWVEAVGDFTDWSNAVMKRLVQGGMLSQKQYDAMTTKFDVYAPMFVLEKETPSAGKIAYEMNKLIPGLVRLDPLEGMIKNVYRLEFLLHQNAARMAAADFVNRHSGGRSSLKGFGRRVVPTETPLQDYVEQLKSAAALTDDIDIDAETEAAIDATAKMYQTTQYNKEGYVSFMRDGEIEHWQFEPEILDAYTSFGGKGPMEGWKIMSKFWTSQSKLLRAGAVLTPDFMGNNMFRDFQAAAVIATHLVNNPFDAALLPIRILRGLSYAIEGQFDTEALPKPVKAAQGAARKVLRMRGERGEAWKDFVMSDSGFANMVSLDMREVRNDLEAILRSSDKKFRAEQFVKSPAKYILHSHPLTLLQNVSRLFENQTRLAVREKTEVDLIAQGWPKDAAKFEASIQAREASTDFSRSGKIGRILNQMKPFFNATIQGNDKLVRTLFVDKGNRGKAWLKGVLMLTMPSIALWIINHDEDWYKEEHLWKKNLFWLFSPDHGEHIFMLPKPFEIGLIFASLPERFLDWMFDKDPKAMKAWIKEMGRNILPGGPGDIAGPAFNSVIESEANYDKFRGTKIVKGRLEKVIPYEQYTSNTSEFAKWMGSSWPGRGVSPTKIDHVIRGATGGLGRYAAEIASNMIMVADPERRELKPSSKKVFDRIPEWTPVVRSLVKVGPPRYTRQMDDFFEEYDKAQEAINTLMSYSTGASKEQYFKLFRRVGTYIDSMPGLDETAEAIFYTSRQIRTVEASPPEAMSRDEKRKKLDALVRDRNKMLFGFMERYWNQDWVARQKAIDDTVDRLEREWDESNGGR